jgi:adenosylcobyric acid synthase
MSADGQIAGTYLHGLFDLDSSLLALLKWAGKAEPATIDFKKICEDNIDRLADAIEEHLDLHILEEILQGERSATNTYDLSPSSGRGMT